jgi:hypothetical protein
LNRLTLCIIVLASYVVAVAYAATDATLGLRASVEVDRQTVRNGDSLLVTGVLTNVGTESIGLLARRKAYSILHVICRDEHGRRVEGVERLSVHLRAYERHDFIRLSAAAHTRFEFRARVHSQSIIDVSGQRYAPRLILDFGDSALLVPGPGRYTIEFEFEQPAELEAWARETFGISLWRGHLVSVPITIEIR